VKRVVVGLSGASGAVYGIRFLELLRALPGVETHLVVSDAAKRTIIEETDWAVKDVEALATCRYDNKNIGATIASGSFRTDGMVIVPCSVKAAAAVAHGLADNLLARAAESEDKQDCAAGPKQQLYQVTQGLNMFASGIEQFIQRAVPITRGERYNGKRDSQK